MTKPKAELCKYPFNKDYAVAITLDDLHPEARTMRCGLDYGYDAKGLFWTQLELLSTSIPDIKYTLFTVADWINIKTFPDKPIKPLTKPFLHRRSYPRGTFNLTNDKFKPWLAFLNTQQQKLKIEYALHGLIHHTDDVRYSSSQEFLAYQSDDEIVKKLEEMLEIFKKSGLHHSLGFRAPGWGLTLAHVKKLKDLGFTYTAAASNFVDDVSKTSQTGAGLKNVAISDVSYVEGMMNFTANAYPHQIQRMVDIAKQNGILIIHAHVAKSVLGLKYVNKRFASDIVKATNELKMQTAKSPWYATLDEMRKYFAAIKNVKIDVSESDSAVVTNTGAATIYGVTVKLNNVPIVLDVLAGGASKTLDLSKELNRRPKISIALSVFNGEKFILPSLDSLTQQNYSNTQITVVNDGSTDTTQALVADYIKTSQDPRITLVSQPNLGRARAKNKLLSLSTADVVAFVEDDALYCKDYIGLCSNHFKNPKVAGVIGPHYVWNKNASFNTRVKDIERRRNFWGYKPNSCWVYRTEQLKAFGGFNENLELAEDVEPGIKFKEQGYLLDYEPNGVWLHMEPANFKRYLRRKFRGGIGMALLRKTNLRKTIVPRKYVYIIAVCSVVAGIACFTRPSLLLTAVPLIPIIGWGVRTKDIMLARKITTEPLSFILFGILVEYIWWSATLLGYLKGRLMATQQINDYLKGR